MRVRVRVDRCNCIAPPETARLTGLTSDSLPRRAGGLAFATWDARSSMMRMNLC